ncbi:MAG: tetratricopeptide repeat protein [Bryobacterales bacterium]|nr:tetratricopeptide repeat protein [Bryobacterales bacterium]
MIAMLLLLAMQAAPEDPAKAMREGRYDEAARLYRQMLKDHPNDPRLELNLGLALFSGKRYKDAAPVFDRVAKALPAPGPVHFMGGVSRLKLQQPCEAVPLLEKARQWQGTVMVLTELGDAYAGCKRYREAAKTYTEASRQRPGDPALPRAAARAYWQAREYEPAKPLYASVAVKFVSDPEFLYEYGDTLARTGGAEEGLPYLEKAVAGAPDLAPARGALGRALVEVEKYADAVPHLKAAAGTDATLLLPLSRAYKGLGKKEEAAAAEAEYRKKVAAGER